MLFRILLVSLSVLGSLAFCPLATAAAAAAAAAGHHRGELFLYWGYNRSVYADSDIRFRGPDYDFTLKDVTAHDQPNRFNGGVYFNPKKFTEPQYEVRVGYFVGDRTSLSLGMTHLKYVLTKNQGTIISGHIDKSASEEYAGTYSNNLIQLKEEFLKFEHTDGLNYTNLEVETMVPIWEPKRRRQGLYATLALGAGIVTPKTNVTLFGHGRSDRLNLAGFGLNTKAGLKYEFLKRVFLQYFVSVGWMNLTEVPTRAGSLDTAEQSLIYWENALVLGMTIFSF